MSKNVVATVVVGKEAEEMSKFSLPLMTYYSKRINADFVVLRESEISTVFKKPTYEKYQISNLLKNYDRVLFLDCDILVSPDAPDIFKKIDPKYVGAVSVEKVNSNVEHEKKSINNVLGYLKWVNPYFNAGVLLLSKQHQSLYSETFDYIEQWEEAKKTKNIDAHNDQTLINYMSNYYNVNVMDLGKSYNFTRAFGGFHNRFKHFYIHYAGLTGNRVWQMENDYNIFNSKVIFTLHKKFPSYTYLSDRINFQNLKRKYKF